MLFALLAVFAGIEVLAATRVGIEDAKKAPIPVVQPFLAQTGGRPPCVVNGDNDHYFKAGCMKDFVPVDAGFPGARTIIRTYREVWQTRKTGKKDPKGRDIRKTVGKPTKEVVYHVSLLDPDSRGAEKFAEIARTHWYVETYHGKRDNGYHEDAFTRRCDENVMAAMMVARSFGMWICARHPERTTEQVKNDLYLHPAKLVRIMMKGGLQ